MLGTETDSTDRMLVRAEVPAAELLRYAVDLRGSTGDRSVHPTFLPLRPGAVQLESVTGQRRFDDLE